MRIPLTGLSVTLALAVPGMSLAGPLTDTLVDIVGDIETAAVGWNEGYQEGDVETLDGVVLRLEDGRRIDIGQLRLQPEGSAIRMDASDVRLNPEGRVLLLKADTVAFTGGRSHLAALLRGRAVTDACSMIGPRGELEIGGFGLILAADGEAGVSQQNQYIVDNIVAGQKSTGSLENCAAALDLAISGYEARYADGSSTVAERVELGFALPGSIASLAADPGQEVTLQGSVHDAESLLPGGATAWAIVEGIVDARFEALGLVPAMTLTLKYRDRQKDAGYWMRLWNALDGAVGTAETDVERVTLRSANVLPPESVTQFSDAGLTTVLVSGESRAEFDAGRIGLIGELDATGLFAATLDAELRMSSYPDAALSEQAGTAFKRVLPVHVDRLRYLHTDDGIVDAGAEILGVPVTVRISQFREAQANGNAAVTAMNRELATAAATFTTASYLRPPARLDFSVDPELDLREALIVTRKLPEEFFEIFEYDVGSLEDDE